MSLLMDLLKRLESQSPKAKVPPSLLKGKDKRSVNRRTFLLLAPLLLLGAVISYFATQILLEGGAVKVVRRETPRLQLPSKEQPLKVEEKSGKEIKSEEEKTVEEPKKTESPSKKVQLPKEEVRKLTGDIRVKKKVEKKEVKAPLDLNTLLYLADRSYREGNLTESKKYYESALRLREDKRIANNLVVVYVRLGEHAKAELLVRKFRSEELAYTYIMELSKEDKKRALEVSEKYLSLDRRGLVHFARGYLYESLGDTEKALISYGEAYRRDSSNPYFAYNYGRSLELAGRLREALRVYEGLKAGELEPKIRDMVKERIRYLKLMGL